MASADLFNDVESLSKSGNVVTVGGLENPRFVGQSNLLRPEREEGEVAVGHVVVLGA